MEDRYITSTSNRSRICFTWAKIHCHYSKKNYRRCLQNLPLVPFLNTYILFYCLFNDSHENPPFFESAREIPKIKFATFFVQVMDFCLSVLERLYAADIRVTWLDWSNGKQFPLSLYHPKKNSQKLTWMPEQRCPNYININNFFFEITNRRIEPKKKTHASPASDISSVHNPTWLR